MSNVSAIVLWDYRLHVAVGRYFYFMLLAVVFNLWVVLKIKWSQREGHYWAPIIPVFDLSGALAAPIDLSPTIQPKNHN